VDAADRIFETSYTLLQCWYGTYAVMKNTFVLHLLFAIIERTRTSDNLIFQVDDRAKSQNLARACIRTSANSSNRNVSSSASEFSGGFSVFESLSAVCRTREAESKPCVSSSASQR